MGRNPLSKTEKTVTTTIRLPEGLLVRIKALVGDRGMAKFAREAFEAKLSAGEEAK
jgi:predicted DNA binding CopG/RHH family protein